MDSLLWYADCRRLALDVVVDFLPPADGRLMRLYHGLYLSNLMALVDRTAELYGEDVLGKWKAALEGLGGHSGENNAGFVRELRNAFVHRGLDLTASGVVIAGRVCALSPSEVQRRFGKGTAYVAFASLLTNVFAACEDAIGPIVIAAASSDFAAAEAATNDQLRQQYLDQVAVSRGIPDWAKAMALTSVEAIPFDAVRRQQVDRLKGLLCRRRAGLIVKG